MHQYTTCFLSLCKDHTNVLMGAGADNSSPRGATAATTENTIACWLMQYLLTGGFHVHVPVLSVLNCLLFCVCFVSQAGSPTSVNAPCSFSRTSVSPSSQDICRYLSVWIHAKKLYLSRLIWTPACSKWTLFISLSVMKLLISGWCWLNFYPWVAQCHCWEQP